MAASKKIHIKPDGSVEIQHFDSGGTVVGQGGGALGSITGAVGAPMTEAGTGLTTQNQFQANAPDISAQEGNYTAANAGQNALASALTNQANGQGPNPALAQLNQTTQQNGQQAAGLVASQRGLNPGEAARMGQQGQIQANQQAGGQAATLGAQQQLSAEQGLASVYGQQENAASQNASVINQGQLGAQGLNAQTAQANTNSVNNTTGGLLSGFGALSSLAKGGVVGKDGKKTENPKLSTVPEKDRFKGNLLPEHLKSIADIYHGNKFAWGGPVSGPLASVNTPQFGSGSGNNGMASGMGGSGSDKSDDSVSSPSSATSANNFGAPQLTQPALGSSSGYSKGGQVKPQHFDWGGDVQPDQLASVNIPKENVVPVKSDSSGGGGGGGGIGAIVGLLAEGGKVPGKPKVDHNAYKNDTVPTMLTPGEVVIPLNVMNSADPVKNAAAFVAEHLAKHQKGNHEDDFHDALKRAVSGRKSK
jgi:hypothetical protein